jgi:hypothetical protein
MDPRYRPVFNREYSDSLYKRYLKQVEDQVGHVEFQVAETPLFMTHALRDQLTQAAGEIIGQLSAPAKLEQLKKAIPEKYAVRGMDPLPNCVQVDFALVEGPNGLEGRVVELQAFPSLYALMSVFTDAWKAELNTHEGLKADWTCFVKGTKAENLALLREAIVADNDPTEVVLVDIEPEHQKTAPDFEATRQLFGVDPVCVTKLQVEGRKVFREKDGKRLQVKRIYNRMVFDELEVKQAKVPFAWGDDLDVTWCSHPNWYWVWSKFALPHLNHAWVPKATYLSDLKEVPADLSKYVLKPLFSFAGAGVVIDVTKEHLDKVPAEQRGGWVLQEKITYANALHTPEGHGVKGEIRVMFVRPPKAEKLVPVICLVRLSRGKMLGVDFNKGLNWTGGSIALWPRD